MGKKKGAPVVIVRKDKRLNKTGHLAAFVLTGGASSVYTAAKAATNAGYNARTRKLMEQAEAAEASAPSGTVSGTVPGTYTHAGTITEVRRVDRRHHTLVLESDGERRGHKVPDRVLPAEHRANPEALTGRVAAVTFTQLVNGTAQRVTAFALAEEQAS